LDPYLALSRLKLSSYSIQFFLLIVAEYFFGRYGTGKGCLITEGARVCGAGGQNCGRFCGGYCNLGSKHVLTHVLETFFFKKIASSFRKEAHSSPNLFSFFFSLRGQIFGVFFAPFPEEEISDYINSPLKSTVPYPVLQPKSVYSVTEITIK